MKGGLNLKNKNAAINKKIEEYDSVFYESVPVPVPVPVPVSVNYFFIKTTEKNVCKKDNIQTIPFTWNRIF